MTNRTKEKESGGRANAFCFSNEVSKAVSNFENRVCTCVPRAYEYKATYVPASLLSLTAMGGGGGPPPPPNMAIPCLPLPFVGVALRGRFVLFRSMNSQLTGWLTD